MSGLVVGNNHYFLQGLPELRKIWHIFLLMISLVEHTHSRVSSVVSEQLKSFYFQQ